MLTKEDLSLKDINGKRCFNCIFEDIFFKFDNKLKILKFLIFKSYLNKEELLIKDKNNKTIYHQLFNENNIIK